MVNEHQGGPPRGREPVAFPEARRDSGDTGATRSARRDASEIDEPELTRMIRTAYARLERDEEDTAARIAAGIARLVSAGLQLIRLQRAERADPADADGELAAARQRLFAKLDLEIASNQARPDGGAAGLAT